MGSVSQLPFYKPRASQRDASLPEFGRIAARHSETDCATTGPERVSSYAPTPTAAAKQRCPSGGSVRGRHGDI